MKEQHKLAAIMFSDITGYSAMMSKDEKMAMRILEKNRSIHKSAISRFNGEYIKEVGDGTLAIFLSSIDAVNCAIVIQKACKKQASLKIRVGIHTGDIIIKDGDVFGDGVNIGSRIEAAGEPGGIYISEKVYDDIKNNPGIKTAYFGEKTLKNIDHPVKIYSIDAGASILVKNRSYRESAGINTHGRGGSPGKARIHKTWLLIGIGAVLLTMVAIIVFLLPVKKFKPEEDRIAVAIFENQTGDAALNELGTIAADWITQGLSRTVETDVVPTMTIMQLNRSLFTSTGERKRSDYLKELARMTKAGIIVSGSYYLLEGKLQFKADAMNINSGSIIYAFPVITGTVEKPMELIEKLSSEVIGGLALHFQVQDIRYVSKPPSVDAYREYIAGMELVGAHGEGALEHLIRAVKMDSLFCSAQFELAWYYDNIGEKGRADSVLKILNRMRERLTPFERHYLNAMLSYLNGNQDEEMRHLRLAEKISPGDWTINYLIGFTAVALNKPVITVETFAKLDSSYAYKPISNFGSWQINLLAWALHLLGDYQQNLAEARKGQLYYPANLEFYADEAGALAALGQIEEIGKVIDRCKTISSRSYTVGGVILEGAQELQAHGYVREAQEYALQAVEWYQNRPAGQDFRSGLAYALYIAKRWDEAQVLYEQLAAEYPNNINYLGYLGRIAAARGDREAALVISERLRQIDRPYLSGEHTFNRACIAARLGEFEQAVNLLKDSFAQGYLFGPWIHRTPDLELLRDYPPYQELLRPKE